MERGTVVPSNKEERNAYMCSLYFPKTLFWHFDWEMLWDNLCSSWNLLDDAIELQILNTEAFNIISDKKTRRTAMVEKKFALCIRINL